MTKVICRIAAYVAGLSFVAAVPPQGVLLSWKGSRPAWAGTWMDRLLSAGRLVKKGETAVEIATLDTADRMRIVKPRAEFERNSFVNFRFQAVREADDFALLMTRVKSRARA